MGNKLPMMVLALLVAVLTLVSVGEAVGDYWGASGPVGAGGVVAGGPYQLAGEPVPHSIGLTTSSNTSTLYLPLVSR